MDFRKIAATLAASALVAGGGLGVAQAQTTSSGDGSAKQVRMGPHGPNAAQLKTLADTLGVTTTQLKAAFEAIRPAAPAKGDRPGPGDRAADIAKAVGVETSAVQTILDANRPAKPSGQAAPMAGTRPAKPDESKLIAALATGLSIDQDTVQAAFDKLEAAHKADHDARDAKMAAALAKELGLDTDKVTAALDATRPAQPASRR